MGGNFVENGILAYAIEQIRPQYEEKIRPWTKDDGRFYLGNSGLTFLQIFDSERYTGDLMPMGGKLTLAAKIDGHIVPDPRITPVDCYNMMKPAEDMYTADQRLRKDRRAASLLS